MVVVVVGRDGRRILDDKIRFARTLGVPHGCVSHLVVWKRTPDSSKSMAFS